MERLKKRRRQSRRRLQRVPRRARRKARNQKNTLFGLGFDYMIGPNAMIFFRHNRYRYFDPNFIENHLKGWETMLELKIKF